MRREVDFNQSNGIASPPTADRNDGKLLEKFQIVAIYSQFLITAVVLACLWTERRGDKKRLLCYARNDKSAYQMELDLTV